MLVSAKEMLTKAREGKYAVGQFNINNLEWTKTILLTAQELNSPVILGVSEGAGKYMGGFKTVSGMVNGLLEGLNITVPVALHLDHGTYEGCYKCIEAGFSSIMFDGSHYPIAENVEKTTELVKICNEKGLSLEAEVGARSFLGSNPLPSRSFPASMYFLTAAAKASWHSVLTLIFATPKEMAFLIKETVREKIELFGSANKA